MSARPHRSCRPQRLLMCDGQPRAQQTLRYGALPSSGEHQHRTSVPYGMRRVHRLRSAWDGRAESWSETVETGPVFARLRERMLELAAPTPGDRCVDLGAGTGFVTLPLAECVRSIVAVDLSDEMLGMLRSRLTGTATAEVRTEALDMTRFDAPPGSVDLVVSNYAFHYLADRDKEELLARACRWLVPGGRLVLADMMIGLRWDEHHRGVLREKAWVMLRRGLPGWWRLLKNLLRMGTRRGRLLPREATWWTAAVTRAGFTDVTYEHIGSEAGLVTAKAPAARPVTAGSARG